MEYEYKEDVGEDIQEPYSASVISEKIAEDN